MNIGDTGDDNNKLNYMLPDSVFRLGALDPNWRRQIWCASRERPLAGL